MMNPPNTSCTIKVTCIVNPSEDKSKLEQALFNIIPNSIIKENNKSLQSISKDVFSLEKIFETIHSRRTQRAYRRQLRDNLSEDSTWFYLNKQAAFVNTIALCEESDESPLGPIKVTITSKNIDAITSWLISED